MVITKIVADINAKLAGETLTYNQLKLFMNEVIDDINAELNTKFPVFDDFSEGDDYNCFPDKYIRAVVVTGAAAKFYTTDEEGIVTAQEYFYEYKDRLFRMLRDYSAYVPEEYQEDTVAAVTGPDINSALEFGWKGW